MTKIFFLRLFTLSIPFFLLPAFSHSQDTSKTSVKTISPSEEKKKKSIHSPTKAIIFSAIVPGLGQAYNKKYWKMPIVYAAMGTTIYLFSVNNNLYKNYKKAYVDRDTANPFNYYFPSSSDVRQYDLSQLQEQSSHYRRFRDLNVILTSVFYILNIADAYVDAQLATFDISDNLSMNIHPAFNLSAAKKPAIGLGLSVTF